MFIKLILVQIAFVLSLLPGAQPTQQGLPFTWRGLGWQVEICVVDECGPLGVYVHEQIENPFERIPFGPKREYQPKPTPEMQHDYWHNAG